ncbi:GNAT family N-acetyltransferase [Alkalihalobacillus sp. AL-G]|uniref:GNAT family N-acetyltransferase n=1 Tax=Alkalihalobacillus sp. AL-G TaxID=2926399 RepID=UPI00272D1450|nr:GNAT family N-acetyltransferase [Alkalihalobacillus sp. AL-G]WLD94618.1 GNAT family N-acetyltransferase [Alkalihalobacillus sp. AL-G]
MILLKKHSLEYADRMFELSSAPPVKDALGLNVDKVEETRAFIRAVIKEEEDGQTLSRVIINEEDELIGVITLMFINHETKSAHIGTWIGHEYWGKGYNRPAKEAILKIAFQELGLDIVFAGARTENIRSHKAQQKLPFIRLNIESAFLEEHAFLEKKEKRSCVLHGFYKEDFMELLNREK